MKTSEKHSRLIDLQARFARAWAGRNLPEALPDLFEESEAFSVRFPWMQEPAKACRN